MESRTAIKFCIKLVMTPTQTFEKIPEPKMKFTASGRLVFKWHKRFREGIDSLNDDARSGWSVTSDDLVTSVQLRGQRFKNRHLLQAATNYIAAGLGQEYFRNVYNRWVVTSPSPLHPDWGHLLGEVLKTAWT